jgi:hypothetical protein
VNPSKFFAELKWRNTYRAAVLYGMVAWLLAQIATQIFPFFKVPNSAVRFIIVDRSWRSMNPTIVFAAPKSYGH